MIYDGSLTNVFLHAVYVETKGFALQKYIRLLGDGMMPVSASLARKEGVR